MARLLGRLRKRYIIALSDSRTPSILAILLVEVVLAPLRQRLVDICL